MLAKQPTLSYAEYLAYEQTSPIKHEFLYGQAFAMAVASEIHNLIAGNLFSQLRLYLRARNCRVFMSDMKLSIAAADHATYYPDIMVVCDPTDNDPYIKQQPCLLIEVLSPSTAAIDQREKLLNYQKLPSLQEYVLVSQTEIQVQLFRRDPDGGWLTQSLSTNQTLHLTSIDFHIPLTEIYEDVDLQQFESG